MKRCNCFKSDEQQTQKKKCPLCGLPLPIGVDPFKGAIGNTRLTNGFPVKVEYFSDLSDETWEPEGGCHGHPY